MPRTASIAAWDSMRDGPTSKGYPRPTRIGPLEASHAVRLEKVCRPVLGPSNSTCRQTGRSALSQVGQSGRPEPHHSRTRPDPHPAPRRPGSRIPASRVHFSQVSITTTLWTLSSSSLNAIELPSNSYSSSMPSGCRRTFRGRDFTATFTSISLKTGSSSKT